MTEEPDLKQSMQENAFCYFRVRATEAKSPGSEAGMLQAIACLERFSSSDILSFEKINDDFIREWVSWLLSDGYSVKTTLYYIKNISALYNKAVTDRLAMPTDIFTRLRAELDGYSEQTFIQNDLLEKLRKLVLSAGHGDSGLQLAIDITVFAILNGGLSSEETARFRKDDYSGPNEVLQAIVKKYSTPKNKYLFPLRQSERTAKQLKEHIRALFSTALSHVGIKSGPISDLTASDIWAMAAVRCDIPIRIVISCARHSLRHNAAFSIVRPEPTDDTYREEVRLRVADALTQNPIHWHAMQLRPSVSYEMVTQRINTVGKDILTDIYYPMQEIAKKIGHKVIFARRPVISGLVYFKCHITDIAPLFKTIGDLAWCYRDGSRNGTPYAIIPQTEITRLRLALADLDTASDMVPAGSIPLQKDDKVEIIGGLFSGRGAILDSIKETTAESSGPGRTICRLLLPDGNGLEWEVRVDSRMVRKISDEKFKQLVDGQFK